MPKALSGDLRNLEDYAERILALVAEQPDRTLDEIVAAMRKRRISGSRSALWRFLDRHGITFKKSLRAAEQHRAEWRERGGAGFGSRAFLIRRD
jgi:transposase